MEGNPSEFEGICRRVAIGSPAYRAAIKLREKVLREPQGMTFNPGELPAEQDSQHIVCELDGRVVGCAVLKPLGGKRVRLRQMAVAEDVRGKGIGRLLVEYAEHLARKLGYSEMVMHARIRSEGFYQHLGFKSDGAYFEEVGLPHQFMIKVLEAQQGKDDENRDF